MVNYIFVKDSILKVSLNDSIVTERTGFHKRFVNAVDVLDENRSFPVEIEYTAHVGRFNTEKRVEHAIFIFFKQHYTTNTLEELQSENNPVITDDTIKSLFSDSPSQIDLQNNLISLFYRVFRIKSDILFTIDDLIVSTGYTQPYLESALRYLEDIEVIEKNPDFDENNNPIEVPALDKKYSINRKILEENDKLRDTNNTNVYNSKYFRQIKIVPVSKFCFVLMPFKEEEFPQDWYKKFLKPFLEENFNILCFRVDDDFLPNKIDDKLFTYIVKSKFIIAEISTLNPNVMYELGMAHTMNKDVILLKKINKKTSDKIPFDINKFRVVEYKDEDDLRSVLTKAIRGLIQ